LLIDTAEVVMRMLVLGAGLQGSACAYDLLQNDKVERVVLADLNTDRLPPFLERYRSDARLELVEIDASDADSIRRVLVDVDACMNALPYYFNLVVSELATDAGVHSCDLGGNTEIVFSQIKLDGAARAKGISVVPDCGLAPGMVNILAGAGIRSMEKAHTVKIRVGGLPQAPEPPLDYQIVYSLHGVLDYYTTLSWVRRNGEPVQVEALSELEPVDFPKPVGTLEAFHTAGGLSTMAWTYKDVPTMEYKTLRYPGHAEKMRAIRDLGLLDLAPIQVDGQEVIPRDVFIAAAGPKLTKPTGKDLVAMRVEVEGENAGKPARVEYDLIDYYDEKQGISAMNRTTGYSLSITGQMQAEGRVAAGVHTPDQAIDADAYMEELRKRGINIVTRTQ
jgi:lysine 6-dehydrogenase